MTNNQIPRPEETTYYQNDPYTQLWELIKTSLEQNIFKIDIPNEMTFLVSYEEMEKLNLNLKKYGWVATRYGAGHLNNFYNFLQLKPLKDTK